MWRVARERIFGKYGKWRTRLWRFSSSILWPDMAPAVAAIAGYQTEESSLMMEQVGRVARIKFH
jgi:hypothetical protein